MGKTPTEPIDSEYKVYVRVMPAGNEAELELPAHATGEMIISSIINDPDFEATKIDPTTGDPYIWKIRSKGMGSEIPNNKSLYESGVKNGDTLVISPTLVAGFLSKNKILG